MNLNELKKEIPYKWKVQTAKSWGCECVAYIDARDVMDILDEVVGPENWKDSFREIGGKMYCTLSLRIDGEWVSKEDIGTPSNMDADKGEASDAFKRAAVKWGIGRFLYDLGTVRVKSMESNGKYFPADNYGKRIYDLTKHINESGLAPKSSQPAPKPAAKPQPKPEPKKETETTKFASEEQRKLIQEKCEAKGLVGDKVHKFLKERPVPINWKKLTSEQAKVLLSELDNA